VETLTGTGHDEVHRAGDGIADRPAEVPAEVVA
jgi:hypothetical protein